MEPRISPLTAADEAALEAQRAWVAGHLGEGAEPGFDHLGTKLNIIKAVLENNWVTAEDTPQLLALGVVFGDVLSSLADAPWVIVEDEWGRDPALLVSEELTALQFPVTMIAKRVEAGEAFDVDDLMAGAVQQARDIRDGATKR